VDRKEIAYENMDWVYVAQARVQCRALVNAVLNLGVP
jgi:hypothetical protein